MRLHCSQGYRGKIIDLDTKLPIPKVIWLDEEAGELEAFQVDNNGKTKRQGTDLLTYRAKGRFKFIPTQQPETPNNNPLSVNTKGGKIVMGAPACAKCKSPLTLPGDDLCPICRSVERGKKIVVERITTPLLNRKCARCSALACWSVSDEMEVTPAVGRNPYKRWGKGKVLFDRGKTVGIRFYCSKHYQPPRLLDAKGEIIGNVSATHPDSQDKFVTNY